ncbi:MAG: hypothetical protein ACXWRU_17035 [Pseudobdellovibrionaceae bacterium]
MSKLANFLFKSILLIFAVNLLVSCTQNKGGLAARPIEGNPNLTSGPTGPTLGSPQEQAQGTSDSGGGTGVEGKVFESYIMDPTKLPAYVNIVKPLLDNILPSDPNKPGKYVSYFKMKTWYLAPVELNKIKKDILGVSFLKSETQQIARQSMKEVWIDKRIFDTMSERDQAELLIHEFVMSQYLIRFTSLKELCQLSVLILGEKENGGCINIPDFINKSMPPEKPRVLNNEDNENIRYVTGWLLENAQKPLPELDYVKVLFNKGFDKRFFNPRNYQLKSEKAPDLKISKKQLLEAIRTTQLGGYLPEICSDLVEASRPCKLNIQEASVDYDKYSLTGLSLQLNIGADKVAELTSMVPDEQELTVNLDSNGKVYYALTLTDWRKSIKVGDSFFMAIILFTESEKSKQDSQKQLMIESIILRPGIVTSIDKDQNPICQVVVPKVKKPFDDGIIVHQEASDSLILERSFSTLKPFIYCSPQNVSN